jgi:hypothetical protein
MRCHKGAVAVVASLNIGQSKRAARHMFKKLLCDNGTGCCAAEFQPATPQAYSNFAVFE